MGIRYYAYPVDAKLIELAKTSPRAFLGSDPLADAWGPAENRPPMLYLDKCWRDLQELFGRSDGTTARPALELVRGAVTPHPEGWEPFIRVLGPTEVAAVAADISRVTEADASAMAASRPSRWGDSPADELRYVLHYLADAQSFTAQLAREGRGLVYEIG